MKKLSILLAVPLLALGACNGGGEAGNNAIAANEAAPAAAGNDMNAAGAVSKPTEDAAEPAEAANGTKPAAAADEGAATGGKPTGEDVPAEGGTGQKPTQ